VGTGGGVPPACASLQRGFVTRRASSVGRCLRNLHLCGVNELEATSRTCFIRLIPRMPVASGAFRMPFSDSAAEDFWLLYTKYAVADPLSDCVADSLSIVFDQLATDGGKSTRISSCTGCAELTALPSPCSNKLQLNKVISNTTMHF
jgi:hypothetical protein